MFDNKPSDVTTHFCSFLKTCESLQNEGDMRSRERCQALLWEYQASAAIEKDDVSNSCNVVPPWHASAAYRARLFE